MEYADNQKKALLTWLLPQMKRGEVLRVELPFNDVRGKADVAIVGPHRLAALEIKGPRDNISRLRSQLEAYQKMFLECWVAMAPKHLSVVRRCVSRSVGLLVLNASGDPPTVVRKAVSRSSLDRQAAVRWLRTQELASYVVQQRKTFRGGTDIEAMRRLVSSVASKKALTAYVLRTLTKRYSSTFQMFLNERGETLTLDDVKTLAMHRLPTFRSS
jgi:hypothetical protein